MEQMDLVVLILTLSCCRAHPRTRISSRADLRPDLRTHCLSIRPAFDPTCWPTPPSPLHVSVCLTLFLDLLACRSRSDGLRAVCCCSMFRSTFKGSPAGLDRHKNRSTPQRYCFSTPRPIWGRAVCLCWHILQFLPVREYKSYQTNNAKLIKATCYGDNKWRDR